MPVETCAGCRFDGADVTTTDATRSVRTAATRWRHHLEGIGLDALTARTAGRWSAVDHLARDRDLTAAMADVLAAMAGDAPPVARLDLPDPPAAEEPVGVVIETLDEAAARLVEAVAGFGRDGWRRTATVDGVEVDAAWVLRHAAHAAEHHPLLAGRALRDAGAGAPTATGSVAQVSVNRGGVPKEPVPSARIGRRGLAGDRQATRRLHGTTWQAVCLWSLERIDALRAEGHEVFPGATGENLTVAGLDWSTVRPGVQLRAGGALLAVTAYATPCHQNARWFLRGDPMRMRHERHPGWSRVYATVLEDGEVRTGDPVVVEP
ncbi:MAG TPA: MOSC domain-containing protein [Acidimicrobiales bacterium]